MPDSFEPGLPGNRAWIEANFEFPGYMTGFDPAAYDDGEASGARLGYSPDDHVCLVTVGLTACWSSPPGVGALVTRGARAAAVGQPQQPGRS